MINSLWGEEFNVDEQKTKNILKKINNPKDLVVAENKAITNKKLSLAEKLKLIKENVYRILGSHLNDTIVIKTESELETYITKAIDNGVIVIDTETNNSLDPITCKLMGPCLYTPGMKQAYVPINHVNFETRERLSWQLTEEFVAQQFQRLIDNNVKIIMHNAKFDYQVIKCTTGKTLPIYWDTYIAARLLNENEPAGLKEQYILHINSEQEKYSIEKLFEKEEYAIFEPEVFALYAATDALMTYLLYEYQLSLFQDKSLERVFRLFRDIEMPCIKVVAEMELTGIEVDIDYCQRLSNKYHNLLNTMMDELNTELSTFEDKIKAWRLTPDATYKQLKKGKNGKESFAKSKSEQLETPINLGSPTQLAILLYDVLKVPVVDKSKPRGTGKDELTKIYAKTKLNLCSKLLEYKKMAKLVEAFIDTLPEQINKSTNRIHCNFRQIGADTGRFSCSNPNLQQIPSKNKEIRMMFKARDGYVLVGSDFSQQEPRLLSNYSQDENMINAYKEGKDLYATIASKVYHNKYEDNLEHYPDGSIYEEGKKRRSSVKGLLLGIMYGMGIQSISDIIKGSQEEAQEILDSFYKGFPKVRKWMDETETFAKRNGYVEDWYGRRRRLPDITLPPYEVRYKVDSSNVNSEFNPFLICRNRVKEDALLKKYIKECEKLKSSKAYVELQQKASAEGVEIHSNTALISQAVRQCVNARIQGGAATMTKVAMIKLFYDKELNDLGFRMLIGVHDELIGECPVENIDAVAERFTHIMKTCIDDYCVVPFKCDASVSTRWYEEEYESSLKKEFKDMQKNYTTIDEAFKAICKIHSESTEESLSKLLLS